MSGWTDFSKPDWGPWAICRTDEAFTRPESGVAGLPMDQRGDCEEVVDYRPGTTFQYPDFRDIAHTDGRVRGDIERYLLELKSLGYRGWRYDMVHGYAARWISLYNRVSRPTFSVGEYDWGEHEQQRGWVWQTSTQPDAVGADHLKTSSSVFDFETQSRLKAVNSGDYASLYGNGGGVGIVGDLTDGLPWKNRAVTFLDNHDTGYRTTEDGNPEPNHQFDSFANNWQVEQAYAQILTHPGVPCVYWKHYFDWGPDLREKIKALINARKVAGVNADSRVDLQANARAAHVYAARIVGRNGDLYVRIGGTDNEWQPAASGYRDVREYARGAGWKVWVKLPGNPAVRQAPRRAALPVPRFVPAADIRIPVEP